MEPRKRRRVSRLAVLAMMLFALAMVGCWDRKAVEDVGFVTVIGLDKGEGENIRVTVQIANPRVITGGKAAGGGGGSEGGNQPAALVQRIEEPTVSQALRDLETFTSRRISMVQTRVIVVGRSLAEEGLGAHIGILTRFREFRRNIQIMVADGTAEDVLVVGPTLERDPATFLEDLGRRAAERTGRAPRTTLHNFLLAYETLGEEIVLPVVRPFTVEPGMENKPEIKSQLFGSALFRRGRMVSELNETETETLLMLKGEIESFLEVLPAPGSQQLMSFQLTGERRDVHVDTSGPQARFFVDVVLEAQALESPSGDATLGDPEGVRMLERQLARQMTQKANALVGKLQKECACDAVGFGHYMRTRFLDWQSWERYNWPEQFPKAKIEVSVRVFIRRSGMTFQSPVGR